MKLYEWGNEGNLFSTGMEVNVFEGRGVGRFEISEMPVISCFYCERVAREAISLAPRL